MHVYEYVYYLLLSDSYVAWRMTQMLPLAAAGDSEPKTKEHGKMNSIYIFVGTLFTAAFVAQMLAYAAFTMKKKVAAKTSHKNRS